MGPFVVIYFAMSLVMIPEASRVLQRSPRRLPLFCVAMGGGLGLAGLAWGAVLLVGLPLGLGTLILGHAHPWQPVYPLVLPQMLATVGQGLSSGASAGLHRLGAARRSLRAMVWTSVSYVVFGLIGAVLNGAVGTLEGLVVSSVLARCCPGGSCVPGCASTAPRHRRHSRLPLSTPLTAPPGGTARAWRPASLRPPPARPGRQPVCFGPASAESPLVPLAPLPDDDWSRDEIEEIQMTLPLPRINYP